VTSAPVELHCDLEVDPSKEHDLMSIFRDRFRPAIAKQPGFVGVKLLRLQAALAGEPPAHCRYRLVINFATEDQRAAWVASDLHQEVWGGGVETTLVGRKLVALLYGDAS
jgi:heme-degrading monooxygenase HmoA